MWVMFIQHSQVKMIPQPLKFASQSCLRLVGQSNSGKTELMKRFILEPGCFENEFEEIYIFFKQNQPAYTEMKEILGDKLVLSQEFPTEEFIESLDKNTPKLIVLDDFGLRISKSGVIADLVISSLHHRNTTCIIIEHNLYPRDKYARLIASNSRYLILFKNIRDGLQVSCLAKQIADEHFTYKDILKIFGIGLVKPFDYIRIDFSSKTHYTFRFSARLLDQYPAVYF